MKSADPKWPFAAPMWPAITSKDIKSKNHGEKEVPEAKKEDCFPRNLFRFLFRLKLTLFRPMACSLPTIATSCWNVSNESKVVTSLMRGDIPTKLKNAGASKLRGLTERLANNLGAAPICRFPLTCRFRNRWVQFLSNSGTRSWSPEEELRGNGTSDEEMAARNVVQSPHLAQ